MQFSGINKLELRSLQVNYEDPYYEKIVYWKRKLVEDLSEKITLLINLAKPHSTIGNVDIYKSPSSYAYF